METNYCLSTRTDTCCPQCGEEFILAEPTDVLASRPLQVNLVCPQCHFPGRATLTETNSFLRIFPSPAAANQVDIANDTDAWLTADAFNPLPTFRRPTPRDEEKEHPLLIHITPEEHWP